LVRKKRKGSINVQELYSEGKMHTNDFYHGVTNLIKAFLMKSLISKGYFKNGVRQNNFDQEDIDDCFTYVFGKILDKYDPNRGTLATFIRTWIRGYGTIIIQKQKRKHKYLNNVLPLDLNLQKSISDEFKDSFTFDDLGNILDEDYFGSGELFSFSLDEVEEFRKSAEWNL